MNEYVGCLKKYVCFSGRARRREYWMFILFNILVGIGVCIVGGVLAGIANSPGIAAALLGLYWLAMILPGLSVTVRRLHDTGHCGWWLLIGLVPLVGPIVQLVFMCLDSQPGENAYGPNPKGL